MSSSKPPPSRRWRPITILLASLPLASCQSYEQAPLDIGRYRDSLNLRLIENEPVAAFAQRLQDVGEVVPSHFDLSDGISYAEGEVLALFYNPQLRIARLEAGVAMATRDTAGLWEDPVFGFDGAEIISPSSPFEFGLMGNLTIPISGRLEVEKDRAGAAYETQLRKLVDAEWRTRAELRRSWATWTATSAQADLLDGMIEDLERISTVADQLEIAGELNRIERRLLRIELADRRLEAAEVDLQLIAAETTLLGILGLPPQAVSLLQPSFPDTTLNTTLDDTARLIESNTELAVHFASYQTAEDTLRLEIKKQFPDIVIGSGYGTEFNDHRVMFGISVPIPILNANRQGIAEARARREVARAEAETTFERLLRSLAEAQESLLANRSQRAQYESVLVPLLDAQARDIDRIAALGELDVFVLLQTVTRTLSAKQTLIDLRVDETDAATSLRYILGPDTRQDPTPTEAHTGNIDAGGTQ